MVHREMAARRVAVRITGLVQGVGFRPFVYVSARERGLTGFVGNDAGGVFIEAQGHPDAVESFIAGLSRGPAMAQVDDVVVTEVPTVLGDVEFQIVVSPDGGGVTSIPPDTAVCE